MMIRSNLGLKKPSHLFLSACCRSLASPIISEPVIPFTESQSLHHLSSIEFNILCVPALSCSMPAFFCYPARVVFFTFFAFLDLDARFDWHLLTPALLF